MILRCPQCTPSKVPMVTTGLVILGISLSERYTCMAHKINNKCARGAYIRIRRWLLNEYICSPLMDEKKNKKSLAAKLKQKYRLVILNDSSFEEKFSLRLTPGGLLILVSAFTIIMSFGVVSLVAFTPIREYIPGYGDFSNQKELVRLSVKADSLEYIMQAKNWYI